MAQDDRPGWWQASDGNWYPPDQHPDDAHRERFSGAEPVQAPTIPPISAIPPIPPIPPAPPAAPVPAAPMPAAPVGIPAAPQVIAPKAPKKRKGVQVLVGILAAVAVVGVGVAAFLIAGGGDDDQVAADDNESTTVVDDESDPEADEPVDPSFDAIEVSVDDSLLAFDFQVPEDFIVVHTFPVPETGAELAPDDPALAAAIDRIVTGLPGSAVVAFDSDFDPVEGRPSIIVAVAIQALGEGISAADQADLNLADYRDIGAAVEGTVEELDDNTAVLEFESADGTVNYQVFRTAGSAAVVFQGIGEDLGEFAPIVDAVAASLDA